MEFGLKGKTALITGGASGIGRETAKFLRDEGANVILVDLKGDKVAEAAEALGDRAHALQADLSDTEQANGLVQTVEERFEMPDIVVCAAGVTGAKGHPLEMTDADWHEAWNTDFMSVVRTLRGFVPRMEKRGWGRVVMVASENAVQPYADEAVYNVAKAGLLNFAKALSRVTAPNGVLVNTVSPAFIETPMTDGMMDQRAEQMGTSRDEAVKTFLDEERPYLELKRRGKPEEVAATIAFLCSQQASFVVGANYRVDGGSVATMAV
ncbi:short-chain dehydrogenase/reductase SDR (plasmid) [Dinoroseobacter shibae DFL 12 = DSM 16493]|jgi:NAD(P)-dependent dehydrogenase (short-subunit alcohol dehydrogenase family)|uniref:Short-chain dehydrogenase/reductase SDR n=1 Tax=Dinoroseobacter shibae (strain DSM 16493 / NCIMB 14021 / DFL 12) TaxID=398580 RepID=A8LTR4_DINSH|nr:SDR family oxidoreductase [Dinoroseobacter shibae]ABV95631.1 short-chain dehydrogenase/reductase SDR [Dinoroseobacter shibae DFL 12 = DSM 16493]URF48839.1 SDR family oxidoreductase [Dinoroseobacter shibae]URF53151.1 SDR family oxidoreductase [Dinoroseobacter shibae]